MREQGCAAYPEVMSELPVDDGPDLSAAAHQAARGHVVYLTEHGERLAAIVPAEFAALLEGMTPTRRGNCWKISLRVAPRGRRWKSRARTSRPSRSGPNLA